VLRKKAKAVLKVTPEHRQALSQMSRVMYAENGIGLAAPQIGISQAMIVVDIGKGLYKLINPKVIKKEGQQVLQEGCLSVPGVSIKVKRARKILLKAQDEFSTSLTIEAEGLFACALQHELDHLKGKLIVDYANLFERIKIGKKLESLKNKLKHENLPQPERESRQLQL